jgi:hypothetical protein
MRREFYNNYLALMCVRIDKLRWAADTLDDSDEEPPVRRVLKP